MGTEFVSQGYIEVWYGDELVSRHRVEREAVESALNDGREGEYQLRFPTVRVIVKKAIIEPTSPEISCSSPSESAITISLVRPSTGPTNVESYYLERSTDQSNWTVVSSGIVFNDESQYVDTALTAGTAYYYRCRASDTTGRYSQYSAVASETTTTAGGDATPPSTPTNVVVSQITGDGLSVTWTASTDNVGVQDYDVLRGLGDGLGNAVGDSAVIATTAATSFSETGLTPGQEHYYRVRARDTSGNEGAYSERVFATVDSGVVETYLLEDDFSGEAVGTAGTTTNWIPQSGQLGTCTIANTTPLGAGQGNYFAGEIVKTDALTIRAERRLSTASNTRPSYGGATSLGYDMWYGLRWRPEACGGNVAGYPLQWHDDPGGDNTNPCLALRWNGTLLELLLSKVYTSTGTLGSDWSTTIGTFALGDVIDLMFRVRWCYRSNAQGGNGAVDVYVNDETTPRVQYSGSTAHAPPYTSGAVPFIKLGGYWSLYGYNLTQGVGVWTARNAYDQVRVQGVGGSRVGVKPQGAR